MWAYPQTNLAGFQTLSSSCLSLCLSLYSRARRDKARGTIGRGRGGGGRRIAGGGSVQKEPGTMEDALSTMPILLQQPERGDEEMDPRVWKGLPNELQDRVLACLPVPLLLQFRLVCKRWKEVISSPAFSKLRAQMPYCGPHFLVFEFQKPESSAAYDPWLHKWYFCLSQILPAPAVKGQVLSVCADGGLLCVVLRTTWFTGPTSILLCNPVTRTYSELPKTWAETQLAARGQLLKPALVALVVDQASNSFKVVAAGACSCPHFWSAHTCFCRVTEVYDSKSGRWEVAGELPWVHNEASFSSRTHAVCGENLYCVGFSSNGYDLMMVFNLKRREWSKSHVLMPQLSGEHILLFERRGALMLVQQAEKFIGLPAVYSWVPTSNKWTEVSTLLPRNGKKFEELFHFDEDLFWVGQGDQLFFVSSKLDQAMMYNISSKSWTITPQSKFLRRHCQAILLLPFDFSLQVYGSDLTAGQSWLKY